MAREPSLRELLSGEKPGPEAVAFCEWMESLDWDFRAAAEARRTEPRLLYREWLAGLNWNQSLAARIYRKPGSRKRGVTRQAIDAQMRSLGVTRPLDLRKQLGEQDLEGALDAMEQAQREIESRTSTARLAGEQLLALAETYRRMGDVAAARRTLDELVKLARRSESVELAGRAMRALPYLLFQAAAYGHEDRELIDTLEAWSVGLRESGDLDALVLCLARLGFELYGINRDGSRDRAQQLTKEAFELARGPVAPRTRSIVHACRIVALSDPDHLDERLRILEPVLEESRQLPADDRFFALDMLLTDLLEAARVDELPAVLEEMRALEDRCSAPWPQRYRATLAILRGDFEEAERLAVLPPTMPLASAAQVRGLQQYEALKLRGEWENLSGLVRWNANQQPEFIGYRFCLAQLACLMGRTEGVDDELDRWADQGFACVPTDFLRVPNLCILAEVAHTLDRPDHAEALHALLSPFAERVSLVRVTASIQGAVARYVALLECTLERWDEAESHFRQACATHEALRARPYTAWTLYDHGRMLVETGRDPGRGQDLARMASGEAAAVGMGWLVERSRQLIQRA